MFLHPVSQIAMSTVVSPRERQTLNLKEEHFCFDPVCPDTGWRVTPSEHYPELWHIADAEGRSWQVAAAEPICPLCGATLVTVAATDNHVTKGSHE